MKRLVSYAATLVIALAFVTDADAQKGRSSSGSSSSSGRSYSSGAKPSSSTPSFRPSTPAPRPSYTPPKSSTPAYSPPKPSYTPPKPTPISGKSDSTPSPRYSSGPAPGKGTAAPPPAAGRSDSIKLSGSKVDADAARQQKMAESKRVYEQAKAPGKAPASSYTAGDKKVDIKPEEKKVVESIREMPADRYNSRAERSTTVYNTTYYSQVGTVPVYNDSFNSLFWLWMLDRSLNDRAAWAYHNRNSMDQRRYEDMLKKDAQLEAKIRELERNKVARDPNYIPPGMQDNPDLMRSDEFAAAAYNPEESSSAGWVFLKILFWTFALAGVAFLIWLIFFREVDA